MSRGRRFELVPEIRAHYESGVETKRLLKGTSRLEFERTKHIVSRYLPTKKPAVILYVGGGPGHYARWLAGMGHTVHLVDPVPLHIKKAREIDDNSSRPLASISLGDARALDCHDECSDAVLMFGPMYHLIEKQERMAALSEALRVLKPGGVLFAAAISRFASALDGSNRVLIRDPDFMRIVKRDLREGQHRNPKNHPQYFTTSFFHRPSELESEISETGFKGVSVFAVEGFGALLPHFRKIWHDPILKGRLLRILEWTEREPSMVGVSEHLLGIGSKKRA